MMIGIRRSAMIASIEPIRNVIVSKCRDCGMKTWPVNSIEPDGEGHKLNVALNTCEHFWLWDEVWAETGLETCGGTLCVGCAEKRLGRKLTSNDFQFGDNGYNVPDLATERLLSRMLPRGYRRKILRDNKGKSITMVFTKEDFEGDRRFRD